MCGEANFRTIKPNQDISSFKKKRKRKILGGVCDQELNFSTCTGTYVKKKHHVKRGSGHIAKEKNNSKNKIV